MELGPIFQSRLHRFRQRDLGSHNIYRVSRNDRDCPEGSLATGRSQTLEVVLRARGIFEGAVKTLLESGNLRLGGDDIYRGQLSFNNQTLVMFELRARIAHSVALNLQISQREYQIPAGSLNVGDRLDRTLAKLRIGQREILFRDGDLPARLIKTEAAQQRLCESKGQRGRILRIERGKLIISRR